MYMYIYICTLYSYIHHRVRVAGASRGMRPYEPRLYQNPAVFQRKHALVLFNHRDRVGGGTHRRRATFERC